MHITRIIPESFKVEAATIINNQAVEIWLGDVEVDGTLHSKAALRAHVLFEDTGTEYHQVFKGYDMLSKASQWLDKHVTSQWDALWWNMWLSKVYEEACL
jgi:hypothetical protein